MRLDWEKWEKDTLAPYASKSGESKGRVRAEQECAVRTAFQRDRDRIIHCKSFRRLKDKTQVFVAPESAHFRTRLAHTLDVAQIARTIARACWLNEDLTEAIALGHDLGIPLLVMPASAPYRHFILNLLIMPRAYAWLTIWKMMAKA